MDGSPEVVVTALESSGFFLECLVKHFVLPKLLFWAND